MICRASALSFLGGRLEGIDGGAIKYAEQLWQTTRSAIAPVQLLRCCGTLTRKSPVTPDLGRAAAWAPGSKALRRITPVLLADV
jgi:hypothetical protein